MIRYVLIGILAVVILSMGYFAVDHVATQNSSQQVDASVADLEEASTNLMEQETPPPEGHRPPQRTVTLEFPEESLTSVGIDHFELRRLNDTATRAEWTFEDGTHGVELIDVPIVWNEPDNDEDLIEFGSAREVDLVLTLEADENGTEVVVANTL